MARTTICKRVYIDGDGNEFSNMPADPSKIVAQEFRFTNDQTRRITYEYSDAIRHGAMLHGFNQAYGDAFAGAKGDADDAVALFDARHNTLHSNALWTSRTGGTGGVKMDSILVEAVVATYAAAGIEKDADVIRAYFLCEDFVGDEADLKTERTTRRKKWMKREDTTAHYAVIKAERDAKKVTLAADSDEAVDMLDDIE